MNAKEELLDNIRWVGKPLLWAHLQTEEKDFILYPSYTDAEYNAFLESIDFEYDEGFGEQMLFGEVGLDGAWLERHEYDGSERWKVMERPPCPRRP